MFLCECDLCIYNEEGDCALGDVEISQTGACENCLFPVINEKVLKMAKKKTRARLELRLAYLVRRKNSITANKARNNKVLANFVYLYYNI